ncbi:MAG: hypothetical protein K5988_03985 [Lachnospiraceae bacterium]|nr:hypothetical protein [Lachnospiraceae bacterium]
MNWFNKMERKFGKYAIPNLPLIIAIIYAFGFLMDAFKPEWVYFVTLNPYAIMHGQVWRLISWVFVPEGGMNIFFVLIFLFFYYSIGRNLEMAWGKFAFNFFFFSGIVLSIIGSFLLFGYFELLNPGFVQQSESMYVATYGNCPALLGGSWFYYYLSFNFSTYYLNLSIFLAYAITYPNMRVLLMFIIPIKVKILGIIYVCVLSFNIALSFMSGFNNGIISLVSIGSSLLNVLIFYMLLRKGKRRFKENKRQKEFKKKIKEASQPASQIRHKCAICGQTDVSNPSLTFRYCSKCNGNYEYCNEHLFTHKHIQ